MTKGVQKLIVKSPKKLGASNKKPERRKSASGIPKLKHRRFRPGELALREIRQYMYKEPTNLLIPRAPFSRVVREVCTQLTAEGSTASAFYRWEARALEALQEAAEAHLVLVLSNSYLCAIHARRVTLMARDIHLARRIGGANI